MIIRKTVRKDAKQIASALEVSVEAVVNGFRDGRVAAPWLEEWASNLYRFDKHANSNTAYTDGQVETNGIGPIGVQVKSLTQGGVKFQQSKFVGSGRSCEQADLERSIRAVDKFCVVDITQFPFLEFYLIDSKILLTWTLTGKLTCSGLSPNKFRSMVKVE